MFLITALKNRWQQDPKQTVVFFAIALLLLFFVLVGLSALVPLRPKVILAGDKQTLTEPVVVRFLLPPSRRDVVIKTDPPIPVSVSWSGGFFGHFARTMLITPETAWESDQLYNLTVANVSGVVRFGQTTETALQLQTQSLPEIKEVNVSGLNDVLPESLVEVELTGPAQNVAEFFFDFSPEAEHTAELNGQTFILRFAEPLKQGTKYRLTVSRQLLVYDIETDGIERRLQKKSLFKTSFTTRAPALVKSFSPQGSSVLPTANQLKITFSEAMEQQNVLDNISLSPPVAGDWSWQNNKTLVFSFKDKLAVDKKYIAKIKAGTKAVSGSFLDEDDVLSFKTVGSLRVAKSSPYNGQSAVGLSSDITITFDQPVNQEDVLKNLSVSPTTPFTHSWSGNTLTINPKGSFDFSRSYAVTIKAGVGTVYGKDLASDFKLSFSTELKKVILDIPLDYQDRALSCEVAALKMALRYKGVSVSESSLMAIVGYDATIKSGNTWGDPDKAFVGNIDGSQNSTGYGVHWAPIAKAASNWRTAKAFSGWSPAQLAAAIESGDPVVIWGTLGNAYFDPWYTKAGRYIAAWKGEHARTVIGYIGSPANPVSFIINDPIAGRLTWSTATLQANWGRFNNSGVVVH